MKVFTSIVVFSLALAFPTRAATKIDVPFTPQAPDGIWVQPWRDACEETSIFMVHSFYAGENVVSKDETKKGILNIFSMKHQLHGNSFDEPVSVITDIINAYLPWSARVVENPTIQQIKKEIDAKRPVIVPFAAQELINPHFSEISSYHVAVISGYDDVKQTFIMQEPGTRFGENFEYTYENLMSAMHDLVPGNVPSGKKRVIFTSPHLVDTGSIDADSDGLTKAEELTHGTVTYFADSDGDGYLDGVEVAFGYLPTKNERSIVASATLLMSPSSPKVYMIEQGKKRHVTNEQIFYAHGWSWDMPEWVSDAMMKTIPEGTPLT